MGRSGGGGGGFSGGGRSGGGFSGGGRSSGGFSGGGRSSGGFSGSGRSSRDHPGSGRAGTRGHSGFGGIRTGPIFVNNTRNYSGGGGGGVPPGDGRPPNGGGCGTTVAIIIVVAIAYFVINMVMSGGFSGPDIRSTIERTQLPAGAVRETNYFTDEAGWFAGGSRLESGMRDFYKRTGVQPYLYLLDNDPDATVTELNELSQKLYDELFTDEAHFLLVFSDDGLGSYNCGYTIGTQAKTVMDQEAIGIFADYLDRYYYSDISSEEEMFGRAYEETGKRIMQVYQSPIPTVGICITVIVLALIVYSMWKKFKAEQARKRRETEEILSTPLEKFGDQAAEDLAKKYEDQP